MSELQGDIKRGRNVRATRAETPLSEIARDVGFGKAMRMYEVFRRELGVTPGQYRKQRQGRDKA